jgi:hypothetical protein
MSSDVQMDLNDILAAFAIEVGTLTKRAILAEQRAGAYEKALAEMRRQMLAAQQPESPTVPQMEDEPVKKVASRRR